MFALQPFYANKVNAAKKRARVHLRVRDVRIYVQGKGGHAVGNYNGLRMRYPIRCLRRGRTRPKADSPKLDKARPASARKYLFICSHSKRCRPAGGNSKILMKFSSRAFMNLARAEGELHAEKNEKKRVSHQAAKILDRARALARLKN